MTDGEFVWFTNAGGKLVCLDWQGKLVWERSWRSENEILKPKKAFPFNKQFEPFIVGDTLVHVQPYDLQDGERENGWHYLYGFNKDYAVWISENENRLTFLNATNGEILRTINLRSNVDMRVYDPILGRYVFQENFNLNELPKSNVYPAWYTNTIVGEHLFFMCFNDDVKQPLMKRWRDLLPLHCFARVNLVTGNCYAFDCETKHFDESAFIKLNPLGPRGETWSLNTPTFAGGKLYHRTAKELICVGHQ